MKDLKKMLRIIRHCFIKDKLPTKIWFGITEKCNSSCTNCNIWRQPWKDDELTPDEIFKIFSDPLFNNVDTVIISGGEPTIRKDLLECIRMIHRALPTADINLSTNGLLPDYCIGIVDALLSEDIPVIVSTSIEGPKGIHDEIRGNGSWDRVQKLITMLMGLRACDSRLKIGFGTVLTHKNAKYIPELIKWADENGIYYLIQWYNHSSFYSNMTDEINRDKERKIVESLDEEKFSLLKEKWLDWLDGKPIKFNCFALRDFLVIKANGDVVPCLSQWNWKIGNLRDDPPLKVWESWWKEKALQTVRNCQGCLNSWGLYWSAEADGWSYIKYFINHPIQLLKKI